MKNTLIEERVERTGMSRTANPRRGRPRVDAGSTADEVRPPIAHTGCKLRANNKYRHQHRRDQLRQAQRRYQTKRDSKLGSLEKENAKLRRKLRVLQLLLTEFANEVSQLDEYRGIPKLEHLLHGAKSQVHQVVVQDGPKDVDKSVLEILSCRLAPTPPVGTAAPTTCTIWETWGLQEIT